MKKLIFITCVFSVIKLQNSFSKDLEFDFQKFINSEKMIDFYIKKILEPKLFLAQKSTFLPFNNYDINEADTFMFIGSFVEKNVVFNRNYEIIGLVKFTTVSNRVFEYYSMGIYPVEIALKKVMETCNLENEKLTNFGVNLPASQYSTVMYVVTTINNHGTCYQSLFDTFTKKVYCKKMASSCYMDIISN